MDDLNSYSDVKKLTLLQVKSRLKQRGLECKNLGRRALECLLCKELGISLQVPLRIPSSCSDIGPRPPRSAIGESLRKCPRYAYLNKYKMIKLIDYFTLLVYDDLKIFI